MGSGWLGGWCWCCLLVDVCVFVVLYSVQKIIGRFVGRLVEQQAKGQKRMKEAPTTYLGVDEKRWGKNTGEIV